VVRRASPASSDDDGSVGSSRRAPSLGMDMDELRDLEGFSFDPSFSEVGVALMGAGPDDHHGPHHHHAGRQHRSSTPQHPWAQALMAHPLMEVDDAAVGVPFPTLPPVCPLTRVGWACEPRKPLVSVRAVSRAAPRFLC